MTRPSISILAGAMLLDLAACASGPQVVRESAEDVTLRWYRWDGDIGSATAEANRRCGLRGTRAMLLEESVDQDVTLARFACR